MSPARGVAAGRGVWPRGTFRLPSDATLLERVVLPSTTPDGLPAPGLPTTCGRLRRKGFIQRIPRTQRHELTSEGRRLAVFFTKTYTRILNPALAELDPALPPEIAARSQLANSWRAFERAIEDKIRRPAIAA